MTFSHTKEGKGLVAQYKEKGSLEMPEIKLATKLGRSPESL